MQICNITFHRVYRHSKLVAEAVRGGMLAREPLDFRLLVWEGKQSALCPEIIISVVPSIQIQADLKRFSIM